MPSPERKAALPSRLEWEQPGYRPEQDPDGLRALAMMIEEGIKIGGVVELEDSVARVTCRALWDLADRLELDA